MPILKNSSHETFCHAYVRSGNATRAYIEAGFSEQGASQSAYRLLRNAQVASRVSELQKELWKGMQMENEEILARMAAQARSSVAIAYGHDGKTRAIQDLSVDEAYAIQEITETVTPGKDGKPDTIVRKIKMRDPTQALRMLAQHKKLIGNDDDRDVNIAVTFVEKLEAARKRRSAADKA